MPLRVERRNRAWRLVEPDGDIAKNRAGTALDGGGHKSKGQAERQRRAIEANRKPKDEVKVATGFRG